MKRTIIFFCFVFLILVNLGSASEGVENLIITEIQFSSSTFIEIYNPNEFEINLEGIYLKRVNSNGGENNLAVTSYFKDKIILSKEHFLISRAENYFYDKEPDIWSPKSNLVTNNYAIVLYSPEGVIDKVGFGTCPDFFGSATENPPKDKSLVRKFNSGTNTYQNTKNNAEDFFICDSPKPKEFNTECYQQPTQEQNQTQTTTNQTSPQTPLTTTNQTEEEPIKLVPLKIDINTASLEELDKLNGVGPVTAQAIIDARPFYSLDDLLNVKGIGPATLEKIKQQNIAYVEEQERPEPTITEDNPTETKLTTSENQSTESIINLSKQQKIEQTITGKVVYESKTEVIRKYAIYAFSILLVVIMLLILKH